MLMGFSQIDHASRILSASGLLSQYDVTAALAIYRGAMPCDKMGPHIFGQPGRVMLPIWSLFGFLFIERH